jgi:hypothetical protein
MQHTRLSHTRLFLTHTNTHACACTHSHIHTCEHTPDTRGRRTKKKKCVHTPDTRGRRTKLSHVDAVAVRARQVSFRLVSFRPHACIHTKDTYVCTCVHIHTYVCTHMPRRESPRVSFSLVSFSFV